MMMKNTTPTHEQEAVNFKKLKLLSYLNNELDVWTRLFDNSINIWKIYASFFNKTFVKLKK